MEIRLLSPRELPGLELAEEAARGARFPTAEQLVTCRREPRLVSAAIAGHEIVAADLADLTRKEGVRVARIWLLASFLDDAELDRRPKCALVLSLQARCRRLQAKRLEIWIDQDDDLAQVILRRPWYRAMPVELPTGPDETMPRLRLVRSSSGEGSSVSAFSRGKASVTVTLNPTCEQFDETATSQVPRLAEASDADGQ